jgi:hypothetical protein
LLTTTNPRCSPSTSATGTVDIHDRPVARITGTCAAARPTASTTAAEIRSSWSTRVPSMSRATACGRQPSAVIREPVR